MDLLDLREPVSAWTHGVWLLISLPGTLLLWKRSRGDRPKQLSLLVFGLSLMFCSGASAVYHCVRGERDVIVFFSEIDHVGIYLLIAGTYTPLAWNLLQGRWRWGTLVLAWAAALAGSVLQCALGLIPIEVCTLFYMIMGWGAALCYTEISRSLSDRELSPIAIGGAFYSFGATLNVLKWPHLWPGVVGPHEVFHVFVMAGSLAHFWFMLNVVIPFRHRPAGYTCPGPHLPVPGSKAAQLRRGVLRARRFPTSPRP